MALADQQRSLCFHPRTRLEARLGGLSFGSFVGLQRWHQLFKLRYARAFAICALVGIAETARDGFDLSLYFAAFRLSSG